MSSRHLKGSRRHIQEFVNGQQDVLNAHLSDWPSLSAFLVAPPQWLSPLEQDGYRELRDDLWEVADLPDPPYATGFWPRGGPSWDAVAVLPGPDDIRGLLLVEAKSRPTELTSSCRASAPDSYRTIEKSLVETRAALGARPDANWLDGYFQMANRLAFLYYLREKQGIPTWLWSLYFLDDWTVRGPATQAEWEPPIHEAENWLGLTATHRLSDFTRKDFLAVPEEAPHNLGAGVPPGDIAIARQLAEEVAVTGGRRRAWRKVTTLMHLFGIRRLTPAARTRLAAAIESAELEADPPLETVARSGTVRFTPAPQRAEAAEALDVRPLSGDAAVTVTEWRAGHHPRQVAIDEAAAEEAVRWYDIDVLGGDEETVFDVLEPLCPGLTFDVLKDLFNADPLPKVESHANGAVRVVSAVAVEAAELTDLEEPETSSESKVGQLEFQLVEMAAGDGWLVSAWHAREVFRGSDAEPRHPRPEPRGQAELWGQVARTWSEGEHQTEPRWI